MAFPLKTVIVGPDPQACQRAASELAAIGVTPQLTDGSAAQGADLVIVVGPAGPELEGLPLVRWGDPEGEGPWLPAGASPAALRACLTAVASAASARREAAESRRHDEAMRDLVRLLVALVGRPELLFELASLVRSGLAADRASVLFVGDDPDTLYVVGASDDASISRLPLSLGKYPEIRAALESRATLYLEDAAQSPLLEEHREQVLARGVGAILVAPIVHESHAFGALVARWQQPRPPLGERAVSFGGLAASAVGAVLRGANTLDWQRERTRPVRAQASGPNQALDQYRDYFESTSDGTVVVDSEGLVLYINHAAEMLTGYRRDGLVGKPLIDLVAEGSRDGVLSAVRQAVAGNSPVSFDMQLITVSGDPITASASTSAALALHRSAILVFRDVTEARALENELRKTKEFLERLIDSAVDGIIVADVRGNVRLFNKGAERIYGYTAEEVVGKRSVIDLYPEGIARQVMNELRSPEYGGRGRLELTRREIRTKDGELVPVNMTAAMVYENSEEVATIGIFYDLREWIKMERSLLQAQEKLMATEKQALIAELAGTTAHELNQPLTSIMGYAELIRRNLGPEDAHRRAVDTILRESERMAEIVRKIGKITRYETKTYVGSTQILDLEKSTG